MNQIKFVAYLLRHIVSVVLVLFLVIFSIGENPALAKNTAVITSVGQSPEAFSLNILARRAKLAVDYDNRITAEKVKDYKTVVMVCGASLKGFGAAGVNLDTEIKRGHAIAKTAKGNGVFLVVAHTGGEGRREDMTNAILKVLAPMADYLLVMKSSNKDGYFTNIAKKKNIPLSVSEKMFDLPKILRLFVILFWHLY
ncbi:MAG: hypothetical protein JRD05_01530 [Deltaproteobacteria bacterium]|nr:hypothetical protein [Deltaproteobacteria bacterium]